MTGRGVRRYLDGLLRGDTDPDRSGPRKPTPTSCAQRSSCAPRGRATTTRGRGSSTSYTSGWPPSSPGPDLPDPARRSFDAGWSLGAAVAAAAAAVGAAAGTAFDRALTGRDKQGPGAAP